MSFDVKYHIQAEDELKRRKQSNLKELEVRRNRIEKKFPEIMELRIKMSSTGARIAKVALEGGDTDTKLEQVRHENTTAAARIKELLMKANYPDNYLDPIYSCKSCKDSGVYNGVRCECYKNTLKRLAAEGINSKSPLTLTGFESFDVELYPDTKSKEGYNIREIMKNNLDYCKNYAEDFHVSAVSNTGLLLSGQTGLGKTHLSLAIAGRVLNRGFNAVYGSAPDLFRKINREDFGREDGNTMETLQSAELLVLDDIGAEPDRQDYRSDFYNLINSRMNLGNPTIISTNLTMSELKLRYGDRILSRFMTMKILKFYGNDIRQIKRNKQ
jgi:DNA replication protein DnaC